MSYTYSDDLYSDLYKDARGFRPGESGFNYWTSLTPDEKQVQWDSLIREMEQRNQEEEEHQRMCISQFEAQVQHYIGMGAKVRETAIRWILDAEDLVDEDPDYVCYKFGLPYGYFKE